MLRLGVLLCLVGVAVCGPPVTKTREEIEAFRKYMEDSRTDNGVRVSSRMLENPGASAWENSGKFEGDIILDDWQVEALLQDFAAGKAAYIWPNTKWPNNVVVYEFGANEFTAQQQQAIIDAINWIQHFTCIRFRRRESWDFNYVLLTGRADGCYASVGYWNGRGVHTLNLARATPGQGCFMVAIIIHEWLHVLGFFHMQSTYDRDTYVRIQFNNIVNGMEHNFERYGSNLVSNLGLPYEENSCMHYGTHAFSRNGQPTIVALRSFYGVMGQNTYVTAYDWLRANRHYNCPGAWSAEFAEKIQSEVQRSIGKSSPNDLDKPDAVETPEIAETL